MITFTTWIWTTILLVLQFFCSQQHFEMRNTMNTTKHNCWIVNTRKSMLVGRKNLQHTQQVDWHVKKQWNSNSAPFQTIQQHKSIKLSHEKRITFAERSWATGKNNSLLKRSYSNRLTTVASVSTFRSLTWGVGFADVACINCSDGLILPPTIH